MKGDVIGICCIRALCFLGWLLRTQSTALFCSRSRCGRVLVNLSAINYVCCNLEKEFRSECNGSFSPRVGEEACLDGAWGHMAEEG